MEPQKLDKLRLLNALWFSLLFTVVLWVVKLVEIATDSHLSRFGLQPLELEGLKGIIFFPFIHGSWEHLMNNTFPILILTWTLFYFYREISLKVFLLIFFIHGFWLWFLGRDSYHIGASGIIYGLGAFIFLSGLIRKNTHLLAISLMVAFLYGSMIWGIFPLVENISWEGHLTGMVSGILLAFYYKKYGPAPNIGRWKYEHDATETGEEDEETEEEDDSNAYWNIPFEEEKDENRNN